MFKKFFTRNSRMNRNDEVATLEQEDRKIEIQSPTNTTVTAPTITPTIAPTRTAQRRQTQASPEREDLMYDLTDEALARGISEKELESMNVGNCSAQVETRIKSLARWLAKNPA